ATRSSYNQSTHHESRQAQLDSSSSVRAPKTMAHQAVLLNTPSNGLHDSRLQWQGCCKPQRRRCGAKSSPPIRERWRGRRRKESREMIGRGNHVHNREEHAQKNQRDTPSRQSCEASHPHANGQKVERNGKKHPNPFPCFIQAWSFEQRRKMLLRWQ